MTRNVILWLVALAACGVTASAQSQYLILHTFYGTDIDGAYPTGDLVMDASGNIFGTTSQGGVSCALSGNGCGTVFELTASSNGDFIYSEIYVFCSAYGPCSDGAFPQAGLAFDASGNLYGTTEQGGAEQSGTVFELSPPASGETWTETVLHSFCSQYSCADGYFPYSKLIRDSGGNLYGTTSAGGNNTNCRNGCGTIFQLTPPPSPGGGWAENVIYTFCTTPNRGRCPDGETPMVGLTADSSGNFYGTTEYGGLPSSLGNGTIFRLSHSSEGWTEAVLYAFPVAGSNPVGELALDSQGRIYGVSPYSFGVVLRLTPSDGNVQALDLSGYGAMPTAGVLVDSSRGVLFGTTASSDYDDSTGTIFEIVPPANEVGLYGFGCYNFCEYGYGPTSGMIEDQSGNLYGTTEYGGGRDDCGNEYIEGCGIVFELTPHRALVQKISEIGNRRGLPQSEDCEAQST